MPYNAPSLAVGDASAGKTPKKVLTESEKAI